MLNLNTQLISYPIIPLYQLSFRTTNGLKELILLTNLDNGRNIGPEYQITPKYSTPLQLYFCIIPNFHNFGKNFFRMHHFSQLFYHWDFCTCVETALGMGTLDWKLWILHKKNHLINSLQDWTYLSDIHYFLRDIFQSLVFDSLSYNKGLWRNRRKKRLRIHGISISKKPFSPFFYASHVNFN